MGQVGRRAFLALQDLLDLGASDVLQDIDTSQAFGVVDLREVIQAGVLQHKIFVEEASIAVGGGTSLDNLRVHRAGDWTAIFERGQEKGTSSGEEVPSDHDALITRVGLRVTSAASNFTRAQIFHEVGAPAITTHRGLHWHADNQTVGEAFRDGAPTQQIPYPWLVMRQTIEPGGKLIGRVVSSDTLTYIWGLHVVHGPPGSIPGL